MKRKLTIGVLTLLMLGGGSAALAGPIGEESGRDHGQAHKEANRPGTHGKACVNPGQGLPPFCSAQ